MRTFHRSGVLVMSVFACAIAIGCDNKGAKTDTTPHVDPQPPTTSGAAIYSAIPVKSGSFDFDDALVQKILDTVAVLKKNDWDDTHDRTDQRRLMDGSCSADSKGCVPKTFARIIPRKKIYLTKEADLGKGHIVAKIISLETNGDIPYDKLALHKGTPQAYWWIGLHNVPGSPNPVDTISVYVPSDWSASGKKAMWRAVGMMKTDASNPAFKHTHASARFVWNDNDDETWVTCVAQGCCQPPAAFDSLSSASKVKAALPEI